MHPITNQERKSFLELKTLEIEENQGVEGRPTLSKLLEQRRKKREEEADYEEHLEEQRDEIIRKMWEKFGE